MSKTPETAAETAAIRARIETAITSLRQGKPILVVGREAGSGAKT